MKELLSWLEDNWFEAIIAIVVFIFAVRWVFSIELP